MGRPDRRRCRHGKAVRHTPPYKKGAYHKVVDTFYDDPWFQGRAHFADGAHVQFAVIDHVRSSRRPSATRAGKIKRKTKNKKKTEMTVTLSVPNAQLRARGRRRPRRPEGEAQARREPHDGQARRHAGRRHAGRGRRALELLLELISARLRARRAGAQEEAVTAFGGLDLCACKRGFFTLRDCANSAIATCTRLHAPDLPAAPHRAPGSASSARPSATRTRALDERPRPDR